MSFRILPCYHGNSPCLKNPDQAAIFDCIYMTLKFKHGVKCINCNKLTSPNQFLSSLGRGPYHRVAGGYTSTPKHGHEGVRVAVEPRSLAVQLAASHPSPPTTPSPPPEDDEDKEDFRNDP